MLHRFSPTAGMCRPIFVILFVAGLTANLPATQLPERPKNSQPFVYEQSTEELKRHESAKQMRRAKEAVDDMRRIAQTGPYRPTDESLIKHSTPDWYRDAKFGVMINYGFFSAAGYGASGYHRNRYSDIYPQFMYDREEVRRHHAEHWGRDFERDDFIPLMTAHHFRGKAYADLIHKAGARYVIFWANHRTTGMPLWESSYTKRDSVDMPPNRDLWRELLEACREKGLRCGPYFNIEVSDYPLISHDGTLALREWTKKLLDEPHPKTGLREATHPFDVDRHARRIQGLVPVRDFVHDYMLPVAKEMIDEYEPDLLWFDGGWKRPAAYYDTRLLVAYYYNRIGGKKPVLVNRRMGADIYGKVGDVTVSEGGALDGGQTAATDDWQLSSPMGISFGYDYREHDDNVASAEDLLRMLIVTVARGGNLGLMITPRAGGSIPAYQQKRLLAIGEWLEINGPAIYATRPSPYYADETRFGREIYYTQSRDGRHTYAICFRIHRDGVILPTPRAKKGTEIRLLGYDKPLKWGNSGHGLTIELPQPMISPKNRPGQYAWCFRFQADRSHRGKEETSKIQSEQ